jgi:hypothetical protein
MADALSTNETNQENTTAPVPVYFAYSQDIVDFFYFAQWQKFKSSASLLESVIMNEANKVMILLASNRACMTRSDLWETKKTVILSIAAQIIARTPDNTEITASDIDGTTEVTLLSALAQYDVGLRLGQCPKTSLALYNVVKPLIDEEEFDGTP